MSIRSSVASNKSKLSNANLDINANIAAAQGGTTNISF